MFSSHSVGHESGVSRKGLPLAQVISDIVTHDLPTRHSHVAESLHMLLVLDYSLRLVALPLLVKGMRIKCKQVSLSGRL
jgi:hypothetical protein